MSGLIFLLLLTPAPLGPDLQEATPTVRWIDANPSDGAVPQPSTFPFQAYRDPVTGQFRAPAAADVAALRAATHVSVIAQRGRPIETPVVGVAGGFRLELDDRYQREVRVVVNAKGERLACGAPALRMVATQPGAELGAAQRADQ